MWYIAIIIMLIISIYVGYRLTLIMDRRLSDDADTQSDQSNQSNFTNNKSNTN